MVGIGCCWKVGVGRSLPQPLSHTHTCFFSRHLAKLVLTTSQVHKWVVGKDQVPRCCQSSRADPKCIAFCQVLARWKRVDGIFARLVNKAAGRTIKLIGSSVQQVFFGHAWRGNRSLLLDLLLGIFIPFQLARREPSC